MFATGLIVFRETLEAAMLIGIVAAATRGLPNRSRWLAAGALAGALGSLLLASGMGHISSWADGIGQDLLNVGILSAALLMLAWHCIWMSTHAKEMVMNAKHLGAQVLSGNSTLWALAIAVALSVLREGAETVLFVAGFMAGGSQGQASLLMGASAGMASGALVGGLLYWGLTNIKTRQLFAVTNVLILLLAGSLASQLAKTLAQAGLVVQWTNPLWDSTALLSNDASLGVVLHALVGYEAEPTGLQLAFYLSTIILITLGTRYFARKHQRMVLRSRGAAQSDSTLAAA
jgi:high-affinity iron transporter